MPFFCSQHMVICVYIRKPCIRPLFSMFALLNKEVTLCSDFSERQYNKRAYITLTCQSSVIID